MIKCSATIQKFDAQGEKTGWTYITIPAVIAKKINPGVKKSYRVKGKLDEFEIDKVALIPMGEGDFIMAINAVMRKYLISKVVMIDFYANIISLLGKDFQFPDLRHAILWRRRGRQG